MMVLRFCLRVVFRKVRDQADLEFIALAFKSALAVRWVSRPSIQLPVAYNLLPRRHWELILLKQISTMV